MKKACPGQDWPLLTYEKTPQERYAIMKVTH
jgi:hypothetical protein